MTAKTFELSPGYTISRVIRGGWQLAGGHGAIDREQAVTDLIATFDAGIWTYDCADIYTGVEELIGAARLRLASERGLDVAARMKVHTKLVPDLERLAGISRDYIRGIVDQSLRRLKTERLDLVQFHWWDYAQPRYVEAMGWLDELRLEGKMRNLGTTNFDTPRLGRDPGGRHAAGQPAAAIFACSTSGRATALRHSPRKTASASSATARWPAASSATDGSARPSPPRRSKTARWSNTS